MPIKLRTTAFAASLPDFLCEHLAASLTAHPPLQEEDLEASFKPGVAERKSKRARKGRTPVVVSCTTTLRELRAKLLELLNMHPKNAEVGGPGWWAWLVGLAGGPGWWAWLVGHGVARRARLAPEVMLRGLCLDECTSCKHAAAPSPGIGGALVASLYA